MRVLKSFIPFSIYFLIQTLIWFWFFFKMTEMGAWLMLLFVLMLPMWFVYGVVVFFLDYQIGRFTVKLGQYQHIGILVSLSIAFAVLSAVLYPFMNNLHNFLSWGHWSLPEIFKALLPGFWGGDWFVFIHLVVHFLLFFIGMLVQRSQAETKVDVPTVKGDRPPD